MTAPLHHGKFIEQVIRRRGYSVAEMAKLTKENRRSIYNWFDQERLKPETITLIGKAIHYDFSADIPELKIDFYQQENEPDPAAAQTDPGQLTKNDHMLQTEYWRTKYLVLLVRHHKVLPHISGIALYRKPLKPGPQDYRID